VRGAPEAARSDSLTRSSGWPSEARRRRRLRRRCWTAYHPVSRRRGRHDEEGRALSGTRVCCGGWEAARARGPGAPWRHGHLASV
jgi:hypothetical protein